MKFLSYGVMAYMLLALIWWTVLLSRTNEKLYLKNKEVYALQTFKNQAAADMGLPEIEEEYERSRNMIWGEGFVFGLSLIVGMWLLQRAHVREVYQSNKEKNFMLSITHELKTPVASIRLMAETLLKRQLQPPQSDEMKKDILVETDRLASLIDNILIASRLHAGYTYFFEEINVCSTLANLISQAKSRFSDASIHLHCNVPDILISTDKMAFLSLCSNLIENAIKYSPAEPQIDIYVSAEADEITLQFTDQGVGIPDEERSRIFEQFYRVGNEETRKTKGTGLGLFIVQKIVQAHKWKIKVSSNMPQGSRFTILIPNKPNVK